MSILVTGGAGFIGSHLCETLLERGHSVAAIDNFDPHYPRAAKQRNLRGLQFSNRFHFVEGDIQDRRLVRRLLRNHGVEAVVHLAARPGVQASLRNPGAAYRINAAGTFALLETLRDSRVQTTIFASSSTVYGRQEEGGARGPFHEDGPTAPVSPYGASKVAGESYLRVFSALDGFRHVTLRLFTVYGPRMRPDLSIPVLVSRALRSRPIPIYGHPVRDFTHVQDVVRAFILALERGRGVYNVGGGQPLPIRDLARAVIELTGSRSRIMVRPPRPGDVPHTWADVSRARRELGWSPRVPLEEGLADYVRWFRNEYGETF